IADARYGHPANDDCVIDDIGENRIFPGVGENAHGKNGTPRDLRAREREKVGEVGCRIADRPWTVDVIGHRQLPSSAQVCDPSQRAQSRHEAIFAATDGNEARQPVQAPPNRYSGDGEDALALVVADERILLSSMADEIAVGYPLRLQELELPTQIRADQ